MGASGTQRLVKSVLLAGIILLAGCLVTAGAQHAHAAVAAVAASSPAADAAATSAPPPATPTTGPTAAPTTASPTAAPSTASTAPSPSSSSTSSSGSGTNLVWLWFVLGALVLLGIILLATRSPAPSRSSASPASPAAATNWHTRAVDAYAKGAAFDGAVRTAERLDVTSEAASIHWADLRRRADDLTEALYAMRETAPTEHRRAQVENAILSLRTVRDAFDAQRPPGGAASQQGGVLRSQLSALESALNALRIPDDRLG